MNSYTDIVAAKVQLSLIVPPRAEADWLKSGVIGMARLVAARSVKSGGDFAEMVVEVADFAFADVIEDSRRKEAECQPGMKMPYFPYFHSEEPNPQILGHAQ